MMPNPMQLVNMLKNIKNPKEVVINMVKSNNNAMLNNLLDMAEKGQIEDLKTFGRNLYKERMDKMIQSYVNTITTLQSNSSSIVFQEDCIRTRSCQGNGWLCHSKGSANYDIVCGGLYEIDFNATISSATAGAIALALFNNGEMIPGTLMVENIATVGDYANVGINKKIKVCCNGDSNISVRSVASIPTATAPETPITTQIPIIGNANFSITRLK